MTLLELKEKVDFLVERGKGDLIVTIPTGGMGGSNEPVISANGGFDWYANQFCLRAEYTMKSNRPYAKSSDYKKPL